MIKTCQCGKTFETPSGWNNNIGRILRCQECEESRTKLLVEINAALVGKSVDTLYIASSVYGLVTINDFTVDCGRKADSKMNGQLFEVIEV